MSSPSPRSAAAAPKLRKKPVVLRAYRCQCCERPVFFRNSECLACKTPLGYEPDVARMVSLEPAEEAGTWRLFGVSAERSARWRRCGNFDSGASCNWLVPVRNNAVVPALCAACRLNRTIPDLSVEENRLAWQRLESAKRRMVSQLIALRLPIASKVNEDPERGLAYDFLRPVPGAPVMTGHNDGVITINIEEADDPVRERVRKEMGEPYRTLLGHFRHEIGHYYWDRLIADTPWLAHSRELFGDERQDYAQALRRNYEQGPPPDWPQRFVSAYASTHPWEDWAETWAHYLHIVDTVDTALSFGIDADQVEVQAEPYSSQDLWKPDDPQGPAFLELLRSWVELTAVMNEMSRAMGQADFYPFVLPRPAVAKLHFVHRVVRGSRAR